MDVPWLVAAHAAATLYMVGVIWFVQLVHYPLMARVGEPGFADYERQHARRTAYVVVAPMIVELATGLLVVARVGGVLAWGGLTLIVLVWFSTWRWQVPAHRRLERGFDPVAHRRLVRTNWVRTAAWTLRVPIVIALLSMP